MFLAVTMTCFACSTPAITGRVDAPTTRDAATSDAQSQPTLDDFWAGSAEFRADQVDTGLPMGESDTVVLPDGRLWSYVHASYASLGVKDTCGDPVPFPGCVVVFESADAGRTFEAIRDDAGGVTCLLPCRSCPCDSRRDHVDQQQYPRVVRIPSTQDADEDMWLMVYEYRASQFMHRSSDGLHWTDGAQVPVSGIWQTWMMPCRTEESIGPHPFAPHAYDCLVGGPPGIAAVDQGAGPEVFIFAGLGQNPGSMGCYRGPVGGSAPLLQKCDGNPLVQGTRAYGATDQPGADDNPFFDFRTISSADVTKVGDRFYMFYEGVRGPHAGASGDTQFALGVARTTSSHIDGPWEVYSGNPILVDLPGNVGVGHADIVVHEGKTTLFTSLDGKTRSRLVLEWK